MNTAIVITAIICGTICFILTLDHREKMARIKYRRPEEVDYDAILDSLEHMEGEDE